MVAIMVKNCQELHSWPDVAAEQVLNDFMKKEFERNI